MWSVQSLNRPIRQMLIFRLATGGLFRQNRTLSACRLIRATRTYNFDAALARPEQNNTAEYLRENATDGVSLGGKVISLTPFLCLLTRPVKLRCLLF